MALEEGLVEAHVFASEDVLSRFELEHAIDQ
jgi:hypothetical protein